MIYAEESEKGCLVRIQDKGRGISEDIVERLMNGQDIGNSIGLCNVHKRMKSIYGEENGLRIISSEKGTCVELYFAA